MSHNNVQGSAFFIDLEQITAVEKNDVKKVEQHNKKHSGGTALYIPLFESKRNNKVTPKKTQMEENNLNLTFTKQDFEKIKCALTDQSKKKEEDQVSNSVSSQQTATLHHQKLSETATVTRSSSAIRRVKETMGNLKKVHSSPDLLASPRLPQLEKSHQELKELITEYDKKEKEHFHEVWTATCARLPKLPKWATSKQMSLDSSQASLERFDTETKEIFLKQTNHRVEIEELYTEFNSRQITPQQQSSLPPIFNPLAGNKSTAKKSKKLCNSQKPSVPLKLKTKTQIATRNVDKTSKKPRSNRQKVDCTSNKTIPNKRKIKGKKSKKKDSCHPVKKLESANEFDTNTVQDILNNVDKNLANKKDQRDEFMALENNETFSMKDSIEVFYDNVMNAKGSIETSFPFPNLNKGFNIMGQKVDSGLYSTFGKFTNSKYYNKSDNDAEAFDLVESMDKTLSIDNNFLPAQFDVYPNLTKVTEEKSPFDTVSKSNDSNSKFLSLQEDKVFLSSQEFAPSTSSVDTCNVDSDGHFEEMTNLVFQQGGLISGSSLDSISINNSVSSLSSNATMTERPYLKSVLGRMSGRSLYTSSSNTSRNTSSQQDDDDSVLEWQKGKVIDRGAFGIVYQGLTNTGQMIAVKEVNINHSKNATKVSNKLIL